MPARTIDMKGSTRSARRASTSGTASSRAGYSSIPIDKNRDGTTEGYAFADAVGCNDGAGNVEVIDDASCLVRRNQLRELGCVGALAPALRAASPAFIVTCQMRGVGGE